MHPQKSTTIGRAAIYPVGFFPPDFLLDLFDGGQSGIAKIKHGRWEWAIRNSQDQTWPVGTGPT